MDQTKDNYQTRTILQLLIIVTDKNQMKEKLNELHLFAGAGGGILGGMLLGHTTVCAVEIEPYCRKVLLQRQRDGILPKFPIWDDVCTFDGNPWRGKVDVVCGGFPCQDISAAGKGAGITGERSGLWGEMARIISEIRPKYAFVENSPMLTLRGLDRVLGDLSEMGYDARWGVVGASHVGAPHRRERIWILAYSTQLFSNGGNDNSRVGLERETQSKLGNDCGAKNVADSNLSQCQGTRQPSRSNQKYPNPLPYGAWWRHDPAETPKSCMGRMANGVANRVDRLKAIGNGQVSIVAATAFRILKGK
jgi:DNA (cytosine-5)-methyltransferase 1